MSSQVIVMLRALPFSEPKPARIWSGLFICQALEAFRIAERHRFTVSKKLFDDTPPAFALILVRPSAIPVAKPVELMVALAGFDELHITDAVRSTVLLSEYVPIAAD